MTWRPLTLSEALEAARQSLMEAWAAVGEARRELRVAVRKVGRAGR